MIGRWSTPKLIGEKLLSGTAYGARVNGVNVEIMLGHKVAQLDWMTALRFGLIVWKAAKTAKRRAGFGTMIMGLADLTDAGLDEIEAQKSRDGTAVFGKV